MDQTPLITRIHGSPTRLVLAVTGGGSGLISSLLSTPGASNTVLECIVPYAPTRPARLVGRDARSELQ